MQRKISLILIPTLLLLYSCGSQKNIVSTESKLTTAYQEQNYDLVLQYFEQIELDKKTTPPDSQIVRMAGMSAFKTGKWDKAHIYLTRIADASSSIELIGTLGTTYLNWGEKELEYNHWYKYLSQLENSSYFQTATTRLFKLDVEKKDTDKALEIWNKIPDKNDPDLKFEYLKLLDKSEQTTKAVSFCEEILKQYPTHEPALFWKARYIFDRAEKWYQNEMTKYNKKPDYTSYAYLRRELKKISAEFRSARDLFVKLHEMNPNELNYVRYLKNCYIRLEMKAEAVKMDNILNSSLNKP